MTAWNWNEKLRRYQEATGQRRILSFAQVNDIVDDWIDDNASVVVQLAELVSTGRLSIQDWQDRMIKEVRAAYIEQAELGGGGRVTMTQGDWGKVGNMLRRQYQYLSNFAQEIRAGHLTVGQIVSRASMYINSARSAFWAIRDRREKSKGMTEERWIAIGDEATCEPCASADGEGWKPIGTFGQPGSGVVRRKPKTECEGLTHCRCRKEYR